MAASGKQASAPEPAEHLDVVETPTSPSSGLARSRFEFETDKRNEGTKILMVEWDVLVQERDGGEAEREAESNGWEVSWEGKGAVLPVRDADPEAGSNLHRVYFLLPPGAAVPALVDITRRGGSGAADNKGGGTLLRTKPMPAIFTAELTSTQDAGRRGVLHTIWAKRRLAELKSEIAAEMRANGESVGLEMAVQEQQWIVDHFGLSPDPSMPRPTRLHIPQSSAGPASPRSPLGGRLGEKLRGLKLATSPADLAAASQGTCLCAPSRRVPSCAVAEGSLGERTRRHRTHARAGRVPLLTPLAAAKSAHQAPRKPPLATSVSRSAAGVGGGGVASLDAMVGSGVGRAAAAEGGDDANEEDLFALPMSPRSPEMKKSPFSIL